MLEDLNGLLPEPTHNLKEINLMESILYGTGNCNFDINLFDMQLKNTLQNQNGLFKYFMSYSNIAIDINSEHFV